MLLLKGHKLNSVSFNFYLKLDAIVPFKFNGDFDLEVIAIKEGEIQFNSNYSITTVVMILG